MNRTLVVTAILAWSCLPLSGVAQDANGLDSHLRFLEPLMGHRWEGGFVGEEVPDLVIALRFEPVLAGKAVRYTREVADLGYVSETHFYWHPGRGEVLFVALNSRGIVGEGVASVQEGAIVLLGVDQWPEGPIESRTVLNLNEAGVLRDTFFRKESGDWVRGHVQEFTARTQGGSGSG